MKYLRWSIIGLTLFFLAHTLLDRAHEVATIRLNLAQWGIAAIATLVTGIAHLWSAWVWYSILTFFSQPVSLVRAIAIYLKTNIAKYLPGNVWHFSGRIWAVKEAGSSLTLATLSVLLEPLLMAAAAVAIAAICAPSWLDTTDAPWLYGVPLLGLAMVATIIHPRNLEGIVRGFGKLKGQQAIADELSLKRYPWLPWLGEIGFVLLRGTGFILTVAAFIPLTPGLIPALMGSFSVAWFFGLVVPIPGGIGVFETIALYLLDSRISPGTLLAILALFRLLGTLAEAIAAAIACLIPSPKKSSAANFDDTAQ